MGPAPRASCAGLSLRDVGVTRAYDMRVAPLPSREKSAPSEISTHRQYFIKIHQRPLELKAKQKRSGPEIAYYVLFSVL